MRTRRAFICVAALVLAVVSAGMSSSLEPPDSMESHVYLPVVLHPYPPCVAAGELVWWYAPDYCCEGLSEVRLTQPCPPGVGGCGPDGCSPIPPCACSMCAPCGNGICQSEYGENRCSCPSDCG